MTNIFLSLVTCLLCLLSQAVSAGSLHCRTEPSGPAPVVSFTAANALKLSTSLPIGRSVFNQSYHITAWCSISDPLQSAAEMAWFTRLTGPQTLGNGLTLFTTLNGDRGSEPHSRVATGVMIDNHNAAAGLPPRTWQRLDLNITVEIIKTAATPEWPERVKPVSARIPLFELGSDSGGKTARYLMLDATTGLTFTARSCRIQGPASFNVSLGPVRISTEQGLGSHIGSTSTGKPFALNFLCERDVSGNFTVMLRLDGRAPEGLSAKGLIGLNHQDGGASGVAMQIVDASSATPVDIGQSWQIARYPLSDSRVSVPMQVRFYQTGSIITPGSAEATLTWTVDYL